MKKKIVRNYATPEAKAFWDSVEKSAAEFMLRPWWERAEPSQACKDNMPVWGWTLD